MAIICNKCGASIEKKNIDIRDGRHVCAYCGNTDVYKWRLTLDDPDAVNYGDVVKTELTPSSGDGKTWASRKIILPNGKETQGNGEHPILAFKDETASKFPLNFTFETRVEGGGTECVTVRALFTWQEAPKQWAKDVSPKYSLRLKGRLREETEDGVPPVSMPCDVRCLELSGRQDFDENDEPLFFGVAESLLEECRQRCASIYGVKEHPASEIRKELRDLVEEQLNALRPKLRCQVTCEYVMIEP